MGRHIFGVNFTGKETDCETGFSYFGARYYDPTILTSWTAVDPMSDQYPSLSPYNYCAWNPVMLVDPNGDSVRCNDSEKLMRYLEELGIKDYFKYDMRKGLGLQKRKKYWTKHYNEASSDQKIILDGISAVIENSNWVKVIIQEESSTFIETISKDGELYDCAWKCTTGMCTANTKVWYNGEEIDAKQYRIFIREKTDAGEGEYPDVLGVTVKTTACITFIHELLDEHLNVNILKIINPKTSPGTDQIQFENTAHRILKLPERKGSSHEGQ